MPPCCRSIVWCENRRDQRLIPEIDERHTCFRSEPVTAGQHDSKLLPPQRNRNKGVRQLVEISDAEVCCAAANVLDHRPVDAVTDIQLYAGIAEPIGSDHYRQLSVCNRHDARDDDLPATLVCEFAHAADCDL